MPCASWGSRVGAYLLDAVLPLPVLFIAGLLLVFDTVGARTVSVALYVAVVVFTVCNTFYRQAKTGQSLGKRWLGITLLGERDGRPLGVWRNFLRQIAHFVDAIIFYIGFLWPLWDHKSQTLADKMQSSVVVRVGR